MGTKAALTYLRSPPSREREDNDRPATEDNARPITLASVGAAADVLRLLEFALAQTDDAELERLVGTVREGERAMEDWARQIETFRISKQLFADDILPDPAGRPRGVPDELVLGRLGRSLDAKPPVRFFWEALAFGVGFVLSLLVT